MKNQFENLSAESEMDRLAQQTPEEKPAMDHRAIFMGDIKREIEADFDRPFGFRWIE